MRITKPLNRSCYTDAELDADPVLSRRVRAERRAVWDKATRKLQGQRDGTVRNNKRLSAGRSVG